MKGFILITPADLAEWQGNMADHAAASILGISREYYNKLKNGARPITVGVTLRFNMLKRRKPTA